MRMAFILFDGMTMLDFSGFHNAVTWLKRMEIVKDMTWQLSANKPVIEDDRGMRIEVDAVLRDLKEYDLVFVPGGMATRSLILDEAFMAWIRTARDTTYKASVCTGALVLGKAGFLDGRQITTNPLAYDELTPYSGEVVRDRRFVRDGNVFTGGGIAASIDLGLFFVESLYGREVAGEIQKRMDYPYYRVEVR